MCLDVQNKLFKYLIGFCLKRQILMCSSIDDIKVGGMS